MMMVMMMMVKYVYTQPQASATITLSSSINNLKKKNFSRLLANDTLRSADMTRQTFLALRSSPITKRFTVRHARCPQSSQMSA